MIAHGDQVTAPDTYTDQQLVEASRMLFALAAETPLQRRAAIRAAAMMIAAFSVDLPDPHAAAVQMVAEFGAEVASQVNATLQLPDARRAVN